MDLSTIVNFTHSKNNFKIIYLALTAISFVALAVAYFTEYVMHIAPCPLCTYQRFPYLALVKITLTALIIKRYNTKRPLIIISVILFIAVLLSGYHSGIERKIFKETSFCASVIRISKNLSVAEIKKMFYDMPVTSCAKAELKIVGLSMAEWNFILNLLLFAFLVSFLCFGKQEDAQT